MFGWAGRILRVDLSRKKQVATELSKELALNYIGGRGVGSRILYNEVKRGVSPLGPDNKLIFAAGPLVGTLAPCSGRYSVTALSPLTVVGDGQPGLGDANCGGFWGPELKYAGYDHLVIEGRAETPVYIQIYDDNVKIKDARHIWGKDTWETDRIIKEELGDHDAQIACIGPAGEKLVRFANIICNLARAAGRTGMGAVMGSKHLKAVVVRGNREVKVAKPKELERATGEMLDVIKGDISYQAISTYGTGYLTLVLNELGKLGTRNNQTGVFERAEDISGEKFVEKFKIKSKACHACPIHCSHFYILKDGPYAGVYGEGPEFTDLGCFGAKCGNSNLPSTLAAHILCNKFGLDTQSCGSTIAWAMECWEKGLISKRDTDGLILDWGNHEAIIELINKIARREGFGGLLAEGSYRAAKILGKETERYTMVVKGVEVPITDPRGHKSWGLGYAVASRGADHLRALIPHRREDLLTERGCGSLVKHWEELRALADSLQICKFIARGKLAPTYLETVTKLFNAVTGLSFSQNDLLTIGERIINVEKIFNIRQGASRKDDTLPIRYLKEPMPEGPAKGQVVNLDMMLDEYYEIRGWDRKTGIPTRRKLVNLGLSEAAEELEGLTRTRQAPVKL